MDAHMFFQRKPLTYYNLGFILIPPAIALIRYDSILLIRVTVKISEGGNTTKIQAVRLYASK